MTGYPSTTRNGARQFTRSTCDQARLGERIAEEYAAFLPAIPKYPLQSRQRGGMKKMEVDVAPASTDRFATMRVNARIFLFIAVLIGIWIKRVIALIALLAAAH